MEFRGAHLAFKSRWQKTDEELCRHSMSFILHKAIRNDFFQSYLYLLEGLPLGELTEGLCWWYFRMLGVEHLTFKNGNSGSVRNPQGYAFCHGSHLRM